MLASPCCRFGLGEVGVAIERFSERLDRGCTVLGYSCDRLGEDFGFDVGSGDVDEVAPSCVRGASLKRGDDLLGEYELGRIAGDDEWCWVEESGQVDRLGVRPEWVADVDVDVEPGHGGSEPAGDLCSDAWVVGVVSDGFDLDVFKIELETVIEVDGRNIVDGGSDRCDVGVETAPGQVNVSGGSPVGVRG